LKLPNLRFSELTQERSGLFCIQLLSLVSDLVMARQPISKYISLF